MVEVDGSDGGGQILRTSLTLSMLTGEPVELRGVRANRPEPGLKPQHLTAVETAAAVCDADLEGVALGATDLSFSPGDPAGGSYEAEIGTAGSVTLLFDTLWPVATRLDAPLTLTVTGGTDVKWSPPLACYRRVKLPLLRQCGLGVAVESDRTGFYPVGGGRARLGLWPSSLGPFSALDATPGARVYSKAAASLADADVAQRQADAAVEALADEGVETVRRGVSYADTACPGSVVVVHYVGEDAWAGFDAYGEQGVSAEVVAESAVEDLRAFRGADPGAVFEPPTSDGDGTGVAVDAHLADQLLLVLAVAGGRVATPRVTDHVDTSLPVFEAFGYDPSVTARGGAALLEG